MKSLYSHFIMELGLLRLRRVLFVVEIRHLRLLFVMELSLRSDSFLLENVDCFFVERLNYLEFTDSFLLQRLDLIDCFLLKSLDSLVYFLVQNLGTLCQEVRIEILIYKLMIVGLNFPHLEKNAVLVRQGYPLQEEILS